MALGAYFGPRLVGARVEGGCRDVVSRGGPSPGPDLVSQHATTPSTTHEEYLSRLIECESRQAREECSEAVGLAEPQDL